MNDTIGDLFSKDTVTITVPKWVLVIGAILLVIVILREFHNFLT